MVVTRHFDMDEIASFNRERWNALVEAGVEYSRPWLNLTPETARARLDPNQLLGDVRSKDVLCLANGGGQQSAAFALMGATVTVLDLSDAQLAQDRAAAADYGLNIRTEQGDMRDLSRFAEGSFDLVCHWYSINFIPDPLRVFDEVARVLRPGGHYWLGFGNPLRFTLHDEIWHDGYRITRPYRDGEATFEDDNWDVEQPDGRSMRVRGPREFLHTWTTMLGGLGTRGFVILHVDESGDRDVEHEIGSWKHFMSLTAPFITLWMKYRPNS
jgi:SAM-dependent methyltransferase